MIGIDTNILLRWLLDTSIIGADAMEQRELIGDMLQDPTNEFVVNHIVIAETVWVLGNKTGKSKDIVVEAISKLVRASNITVPERPLIEAAVQSFSNHPGDFEDHLIGETNKKLGCHTTLTFDRAAAKSPLFSQLKK